MSEREEGKVVDAEIEDIETGLAVTGSQEITFSSPAEKLQSAIDAVGKMQELGRVVRQAAIQQTKPCDWRDWNGKLRMEESGAMSIGRTFGVHHDPPDISKLDVGEGGYAIVVKGNFHLPTTGASTYVEGSCRWDDDIVATRYEYKDGKRSKIKLHPTEVDETTVRKKALANWKVNGISSLMGLKNVSPQELAGLGITVSTQGVSHSKKAWEISPGQKSMLEKFKCTPAEIAACKSNADVTTLMNKRKDAPRGERSGSKKEEAPATAPPADGSLPGLENNEDAPQRVVNQLAKTAQTAGITWMEVDQFRLTCFNKKADVQWTMRRVTHATKWMASGKTADDYAATMGA